MKDVAVTVAVDGSPSGDPDAAVGPVRAAGGGQADGPDEVGVGEAGGELQQADVVVLGLAVVVGVVDDLGHAPGLLVGVKKLLLVASEVHGDLRGADPERGDAV